MIIGSTKPEEDVVMGLKGVDLALACTGLSLTAKELVGRKFHFEFDTEHPTIPNPGFDIFGTITGIVYEGGDRIKLFISASAVSCHGIKYLERMTIGSKIVWAAVLSRDSTRQSLPSNGFCPGQFELV